MELWTQWLFLSCVQSTCSASSGGHRPGELPPLARTAISSEIASTVKDSLQDVVQDRPAFGTHTFDFPLRDRQPYRAPDAKSSVKLPWTHTMNH